MAGGGFWIYSTYFQSKEINTLELISEEAVFTLETTQADQLWNEWVQHPSWAIFSQFPAFQTLSEQVTFLDSLTGSSGKISKTLRGKQVTISYHGTGKENFSLLFAVNFGGTQAEELLAEFKNLVGSSATVQTRTYSDQPIWEFQTNKDEPSWTVALINHVLLASNSSFLVEEAIRSYLNQGENTLKTLMNEESAFTGKARLILTSKGISRLLKGIAQENKSRLSASLGLRKDWTSLELEFLETELALKGTTSAEQITSFLPSVQANLPAFEKLISNRTQALTQINLNGIFETQKLKNPAFTPKSTVQGEIQTKLIDRGFLDSFTGELYLLQLEEIGNQTDNQVLLARSNYPEQAWTMLKEFRGTEEIPSNDFYLGNEILFFPEEEFPAHLFEGKFQGFPQTHVTTRGDMLIMANSAIAMKMLLDDIDSSNTWAYSPNSPLMAIDPASGFSETIFLEKIWKQWIDSSNPSWSTFLQKHRSTFLAFPYLSLRLNQLGKRTEATLSLPFNATAPGPKKESDALILQANRVIELPSRLIYGPKIAINFNDQTEDLVVQTEEHTLHLFSSEGEKVVEIPLQNPIVSDIFQIDYYKNGKLQLLFATADGIYGIDRLGNSLPGFPITKAGEKFSKLNLVDYDQNRDYRFFAASESGNLWLFDKTGQALEGWNPLPLKSSALTPPTHIRVPGKGDFMAVQTSDGKVHLFNRRGENQTGSPIDFQAEINTPITITPDAGSLKISAISTTGEVIQAGFGGEIRYRNQLVKENRDDRFSLIGDLFGGTFLIANKQFNRTQILDESESILFTIPQTGESWIRFVDFGSERKILLVTDSEQGFGFLYDWKGAMLTATPLESEGEIQISHQAKSKQYFIRTRSGNRILEYVMPE